MKIVIITLLAGCALPHIKPQPRTPQQAQLAVARLDIECAHDGIDYGAPKVATGVVISERHILTAGHAVVCPVLPKIKATLANGETFKLYVERDEFSFGDGRDIARLRLASADRFGLSIAPPELGEPTEITPVNEMAKAKLNGGSLTIGGSFYF